MADTDDTKNKAAANAAAQAEADAKAAAEAKASADAKAAAEAKAKAEEEAEIANKDAAKVPSNLRTDDVIRAKTAEVDRRFAEANDQTSIICLRYFSSFGTKGVRDFVPGELITDELRAGYFPDGGSYARRMQHHFIGLQSQALKVVGG